MYKLYWYDHECHDYAEQFDSFVVAVKRYREVDQYSGCTVLKSGDRHIFLD